MNGKRDDGPTRQTQLPESGSPDDKPTGHMAKVKFLYEELGEIDDEAEPATRRQ